MISMYEVFGGVFGGVSGPPRDTSEGDGLSFVVINLVSFRHFCCPFCCFR